GCRDQPAAQALLAVPQFAIPLRNESVVSTAARSAMTRRIRATGPVPASPGDRPGLRAEAVALETSDAEPKESEDWLCRLKFTVRAPKYRNAAIMKAAAIFA